MSKQDDGDPHLPGDGIEDRPNLGRDRAVKLVGIYGLRAVVDGDEIILADCYSAL